MRISHARIDNCDGIVEDVFQVMRTTCPQCHKSVQFAIQQDDKDYAEMEKFQTKRIQSQAKEIYDLKQMINKILDLKQ